MSMREIGFLLIIRTYAYSNSSHYIYRINICLSDIHSTRAMLIWYNSRFTAVIACRRQININVYLARGFVV